MMGNPAEQSLRVEVGFILEDYPLYSQLFRSLTRTKVLFRESFWTGYSGLHRRSFSILIFPAGPCREGMSNAAPSGATGTVMCRECTRPLSEPKMMCAQSWPMQLLPLGVSEDLLPANLITLVQNLEIHLLYARTHVRMYTQCKHAACCMLIHVPTSASRIPRRSTRELRSPNPQYSKPRSPQPSETILPLSPQCPSALNPYCRSKRAPIKQS